MISRYVPAALAVGLNVCVQVAWGLIDIGDIAVPMPLLGVSYSHVMDTCRVLDVVLVTEITPCSVAPVLTEFGVREAVTRSCGFWLPLVVLATATPAIGVRIAIAHTSTFSLRLLL